MFWNGVYDKVCKEGYICSFSGMIYVAKRTGLRIKSKAFSQLGTSLSVVCMDYQDSSYLLYQRFMLDKFTLYFLLAKLFLFLFASFTTDWRFFVSCVIMLIWNSSKMFFCGKFTILYLGWEFFSFLVRLILAYTIDSDTLLERCFDVSYVDSKLVRLEHLLFILR